MGLEESFQYYPIFFKATGGMRELNLKQREEIMVWVRFYLSDKSFCPFYFHDDFARVISGNEQSVIMSMFLSVCQSVSVFVYLCVYVYMCAWLCLYACLCVCLSVCLYICLSVYFSVYMSVSLSVCLLVCVSFCLYVSVCLYICLCICLFNGDDSTAVSEKQNYFYSVVWMSVYYAY